MADPDIDAVRFNLYPQKIYLLEDESTPGYSAAGSTMSIKNSNDNIENRTRDLPACSAVPQPTAPPRASYIEIKFSIPRHGNVV
jgi:hypothetical protein